MTAVRVDVPDDLSDELTGVLASLPDDFVVASADEKRSTAEVVVVDGRRPDWPTTLRDALPTVRGVLLREPCLPPTGDTVSLLEYLVRRAGAAGTPVVVDRRWSGAPGVATFARTFGDKITASTSVTVLVVEDDTTRHAGDALLDTVGLARTAGAVVEQLYGLNLKPGSWSAWGRTTTGAVAHLQGVHSAAGCRAVLTASSASSEVSVHVPDARSAAPATGRSAEAAGGWLVPTEFESAARYAWRRLHRLLRRPRGETYTLVAELAALAQDTAVVDVCATTT